MGAFPPPHLLTQPMVNESKRMVQLWFSVNHAVSLGLNLLLVLVIWAAKLKRHPVLLSFFVAIMVADVFNLLLVRHPEHPEWNLCLVSQAATTGSTALVTSAAMSMVIVVWSLLRDRAGKRVMGRGFVPLLICLPWTMFTGIFVMSVLTTSLRGDLVTEVTTCYAYNYYTDISHAIAVLSVVVAIFFNIWGIILFVRNWMYSRSLTIGGPHPDDVEVRRGHGSAQPGVGLNRGFTLRVLIFGTALIVGLGAALVIILAPESHAPALFQSSLGLICFLLFGTQRDTYDALFSRTSSTASIFHKLSHTYRTGQSTPAHLQPQFEISPPSRRTSLVPPPRSADPKKEDQKFVPTLSALGVGDLGNANSGSRSPSFASSRLSFGAMFRSSPRPEMGLRGLSTKKEEEEGEAIGDGWDDLGAPIRTDGDEGGAPYGSEKEESGVERVVDVDVEGLGMGPVEGMDSSGSSSSGRSGRSGVTSGTSSRNPS